jgi:hypothetical protein
MAGMVNVCAECKKPAIYLAQTYDGQTIYLCEDHVKDWKVPKLKKLKSEVRKSQKAEPPKK